MQVASTETPKRRRGPPKNPRPANPEYLLSVTDAGKRFFGFGVRASWAAYKRGDFVVVKVGRRVFVSVPGMVERLTKGWVSPTRHPHANDMSPRQMEAV